MLGGFYTAASGVLTQQRTLNVIANNMANDKTPGFKGESVVSTTFEQALLTRQEANHTGRVGKGAPIRIVQDVPAAFDPALLVETGRPFDIAINGEGFFTVQTPEGDQYLTRNGSFDLDEEGYLSQRGVGRVVGVKGEIQLNSSNFAVDPDGSVYNSEGKLVDKLLINVAKPGTSLTKYVNGMFVPDENPPVRPAIPGEPAPPEVEPGIVPVLTPNLVQGVLEGSNIDMNREMSLLMETQRTFQSCSKVMQIIDQVNQKTVGLAGM